jgi:NADP-dependent 3-hydroxy acid dehydrogenase YdfG
MDQAGAECVHLRQVAPRGAVASLPTEVQASRGAVDALINNAGVIRAFVEIKDTDYDTIQRLLDVNLMATIHMVKAFLPELLDRRRPTW